MGVGGGGAGVGDEVKLDDEGVDDVGREDAVLLTSAVIVVFVVVDVVLDVELCAEVVVELVDVVVELVRDGSSVMSK